MSAPQVIVVAGPTASGKTALGIALARRYHGEIVSADSMQIYRRMDIGTAKARSRRRTTASRAMWRRPRAAATSCSRGESCP